MMKAILIFVFPFLFFAAISAQEKTAWDYPVKPGMKEWAAFETGEQMFNACQIPVNILEKLTTKELAAVCLNYPLFNNYVAFNDERKGIRSVIEQFNGLQELNRRKDGVRELINVYASYPVISQIQTDVTSEDYHTPYKLPFLEMVLSDSTFVSQMTNDELSELRRNAVNKYGDKLRNPAIYSLFNVKKTMLLIAIILDRQSETGKRDVVDTFIKNYSNPPSDTLTELSKIIAEL
jgi:carbonic anhydrase